MDKTATLTNKFFLNTILRNILVLIFGFILSWIGYAVFFSANSDESQFAGLGIFFIYITMFFCAIVIENVFYLLFKKNIEKAFLAMFLAFLVFVVWAGFSLQTEFFLELGTFFLVFTVLQILGFFLQRKITKRQ